MIDTLIRASEQDRPIAVRIEDMERVAAEVFVVPGGVGFADIGWNSPYPGAHPFHIVHGYLETSGERFWTFIDQTGRTIQFWEIDEDDELLNEWLLWLELRNKQPSKYQRKTAQSLILRLAS